MKTIFMARLLLFLLFSILILSSCSDGQQSIDHQSETVQSATVAPQPGGDNFLNIINDKIDEAPDNPELYAARAEHFYNMEAYDQAVLDLQKAMSYDSINVHYHHLLADVYLDHSKSYYAVKTMERAAKLHPKRIATLLKLGEFQLIVRKYPEAFKTLDLIMKIDAQNAEGFYLAGRVYRDQKELDKAIASMQKAVDNDPELIAVWLELGEMYAEKNDPKAMRYFDTALRIDPENVDAQFQKAFYLHTKGKLKEAVVFYKKIIAQDKNYMDAYFNTGLAYMEMDSIENAFNNFNIICNTNPRFPQAYYYKGLANEKLGEYGKAISDYTRMTRLEPSNKAAQEALVRVQKLQARN